MVKVTPGNPRASARASIAAEKSSAWTGTPNPARKAVFLPVPQPSSRMLVGRSAARVARVACASRSRVRLRSVSYPAAQRS